MGAPAAPRRCSDKSTYAVAANVRGLKAFHKEHASDRVYYGDSRHWRPFAETVLGAGTECFDQ